MTPPDTEKFRLRHFVEKLVQEGECVVHDDPIDLIDVAAVLDCNPNAVWFRAVGPEKTELVGNVMGTRRRLAAALDTDESRFPAVLRERLRHPLAPIEVPSAQAPVHEVVLTGDDADLTTLPVHLQHGLDGAPYISASIDYARDPQLERHQYRLPPPDAARPAHRPASISTPRATCARSIRRRLPRGERMPVAFAVGSHPADFLAAVAATPPMDELEVVGAVRGAPLPVVKCVTIDVKVPADAELVLEGYLDERGLVEPEGPYGEYIGYYGLLKSNPVFHLTAITKRRDALFQTVTIGGARLGYTDTAQLGAAKTEAAIWSVLQQADPRAGRGLLHRLVRRHVQRARLAAPAQSRRSAQRHRGGVLLQPATSSMCSWSTTTSTCSPTSRSTGRWPRAFRPIATSWWRPASAASRSIPRCKAAAPAPRPVSTAPSRSARATASNSRCRIRRNCRSAARQRSKRRWPTGPATYLELMAALGTRDGREILRDFDKLYAAGPAHAAQRRPLHPQRRRLNGAALRCLGSDRGQSGALRVGLLPGPIVVARHQILDQLVELGPVGFAVGMIADDERGAGIELLVLQVPARELRCRPCPRRA